LEVHGESQRNHDDHGRVRPAGYRCPRTPRQDEETDIGFLAVCEKDRIAGTITDRDIVIRAVASGRDIASVKASDVMTKNVHCCSESDDTKDVSKKMRDKGVRRMLILDQDKRIAGVVSIGDISKVE
jgi:CBS domain-containing protein